MRNLGKERETVNQLGLNDKSVKRLGDKDYSESISSELGVKEGNFSDSAALKKELKTEKSQQDVITIYSEVKKEVEVKKIDKNSQSKVTASKSKFKNVDHQNFKKALGKVNKFRNPTQQISVRSAKSPKKSSSSNIEKLSDSEKKSIKDFFQQYQSLDKDKSQFSGDLSKATGEIKLEPLTQNICLSCIPGNLNKIGWLGKDLNLFEKVSTYRSNPINSHHYYSSTAAPDKDKAKQTWGHWAEFSHPYYYFFDSEEKWLESVNKIAEFWNAYYGYVNNRLRRFTSLITMGYSGSTDKSGLEKGIDDSKASFELEIATKLMSVMRRLS